MSLMTAVIPHGRPFTVTDPEGVPHATLTAWLFPA
jgi:hypothetical protein